MHLSSLAQFNTNSLSHDFICFFLYLIYFFYLLFDEAKKVLGYAKFR